MHTLYIVIRVVSNAEENNKSKHDLYLVVLCRYLKWAHVAS